MHEGPIIFSPSAPGSVEMAVDLLVNGGVLAIPTDTVYGLAASLAHPEAIDRIFALKGRDRSKPLPVLVSSTEALEHLAANLDPDVGLLLDEYWPGPLTVVVRPGVQLPSQVLAEDGTVGLRLPNHQLAIELIERAGGMIACTSANVSGAEPERTASNVLATLGTEIDGIVDGGVAPGGVSSTVIGFAGDDIVVYREGAIPSEHILAAWSELREG